MRRSLPNPGMPRMQDQLLVLPPVAKVVTGAAMLGMGVVAAFLVPGAFPAMLLLGAGVGMGLPLLLLGRAEWRARHRHEAERSRAERELDVLRDAVAAARRDGKVVSRMLEKRGYACDEVRDWIVRECADPSR